MHTHTHIYTYAFWEYIWQGSCISLYSTLCRILWSPVCSVNIIYLIQNMKSISFKITFIEVKAKEIKRWGNVVKSQTDGLIFVNIKRKLCGVN